MSHRERRHLRTDELPGNLNEALDALEKDDLLDIGLTDRWLLNVDLRWYDLDTEIHLDDVGEVGSVSIDPVAYGVMFGYRFGGSRR